MTRRSRLPLLALAAAALTAFVLAPPILAAPPQAQGPSADHANILQAIDLAETNLTAHLAAFRTESADAHANVANDLASVASGVAALNARDNALAVEAVVTPGTAAAGNNHFLVMMAKVTRNGAPLGGLFFGNFEVYPYAPIFGCADLDIGMMTNYFAPERTGEYGLFVTPKLFDSSCKWNAGAVAFVLEVTVDGARAQALLATNVANEAPSGASLSSESRSAAPEGMQVFVREDPDARETRG